MDRRSRLGPEPTTLEAVGNQWHYALIVVQAGEEEETNRGSNCLSTCKFSEKDRSHRKKLRSNFRKNGWRHSPRGGTQVLRMGRGVDKAG